MLKYRFLTALILVPIVLVVIWFLPMPWFAILMAAVIVWAAWEWALLMNIHQTLYRLLYMLLIVGVLVGSYFLPVQWVLVVSLIAWLWAFAAVICYQFEKKPLGFQHPWVVGIMGALALVPCWLSISVLREDIGGPIWLLFALVVIWAMDTGAYFAGKFWGKHKLIPHVSPNKTREGLYGGVALVFVIALIVSLAFRVPCYRLVTICVLSIITALFAAVGDLFESMLKRQVDVKDSGRGLPGHGGILDRIDSLIAALPVFTLGSLLFSNFL